MPRFATTSVFANWEEVLTSGKIEAFKGENFIALDSMKLKEDERHFLKKNRHKIQCPACQEMMYFKSGFCRKGEYVNPHWAHKRSGAANCFRSESAIHAETKRFIFNKLLQRGYKVREEEVHKINDRYVRADVAVLEEVNNADILKLVVEVQASDIRASEIKKRIAAYYQEQAPVAWVLLLDTFFDRYKFGMEAQTYDEEKRHIKRSLIPDQEYDFIVTGKDQPDFNLLMELYFYVIAVRLDGNVFLIRRSPEAAWRREEAISKGESWSSPDDEYKISLIHDDRIADVLLNAPLIDPGYDPDPKHRTSTSAPKGKFRGDDCIELPGLEQNHNPLSIDFEHGRTTDTTLDSLKLIQETQAAAKQARLEMQRRAEAEKKRKQIEKQKRQAKEQLARHQKTVEQAAAFEEKLLQEKRAAEQAQLEMQRHRAEAEESKRRQLEKQEWQAKELSEKLSHETAEEQTATLTEEQTLKTIGMEKKYHEPANADIEAVFEMRKALWARYLEVPEEKRTQWQEDTFEGGLPNWFASKMFRLREKELQKQKKALSKQPIKQNVVKTENPDQLTLFSDSHSKESIYCGACDQYHHTADLLTTTIKNETGQTLGFQYYCTNSEIEFMCGTKIGYQLDSSGCDKCGEKEKLIDGGHVHRNGWFCSDCIYEEVDFGSIDDKKVEWVYCQSCDEDHSVDECYSSSEYINEDEEPHNLMELYFCPIDRHFVCCSILDGEIVGGDERRCDSCSSNEGPFTKKYDDVNDIEEWYCEDCNECDICGVTGLVHEIDQGNNDIMRICDTCHDKMSSHDKTSTDTCKRFDDFDFSRRQGIQAITGHFASKQIRENLSQSSEQMLKSFLASRAEIINNNKQSWDAQVLEREQWFFTSEGRTFLLNKFNHLLNKHRN